MGCSLDPNKFSENDKLISLTNYIYFGTKAVIFRMTLALVKYCTFYQKGFVKSGWRSSIIMILTSTA